MVQDHGNRVNHLSQTHTKENRNMCVAGIDVGHKELVLVIQKENKNHKPRSFTNDPEGHAAVIKALRHSGVTRVCIEATGAYHLDLAVAMHDAGNIEVMVVNPKAAKRFAEAMMNRSKTDAVDASVLAEFAVRMPFVAWVRPSDEVLAARAYGRYLAALTKPCTQLKNQRHALLLSKTTPAAMIAAVTTQIQELEIQIELIRAKALKLILSCPILRQPYELLLSVKGIARASAIALLGE